MIGASPLASIFATPTLAALLAVFAREPERRFYQKELVSLTGGSLYLVQRELKRLEKAGLLTRLPRGRQIEYEANVHHPAFQGLRAALLGTIALADRLAAALKEAGDVRVAFIFGSVARGDDTTGSDLDLLVVGNIGLRKVSKYVMPVARDLGREPNVVVFSEEELRERAGSGEHFVSVVLSEPKLWIVGDDEELAATLG